MSTQHADAAHDDGHGEHDDDHGHGGGEVKKNLKRFFKIYLWIVIPSLLVTMGQCALAPKPGPIVTTTTTGR